MGENFERFHEETAPAPWGRKLSKCDDMKGGFQFNNYNINIINFSLIQNMYIRSEDSIDLGRPDGRASKNKKITNSMNDLKIKCMHAPCKMRRRRPGPYLMPL